MPEEVIEGMNDLLKSMEDLSSLVKQKNIIAGSLRLASKPILEEAQSRAPDDPETTGSRIEVSMKIQVKEQSSFGAVAVIGPSGAGFVGIFSETGTAHQTAAPWLKPAFDSKKDEAVGILRKELGDKIARAFKRQNRAKNGKR